MRPYQTNNPAVAEVLYLTSELLNSIGMAAKYRFSEEVRQRFVQETLDDLAERYESLRVSDSHYEECQRILKYMEAMFQDSVRSPSGPPGSFSIFPEQR